MVNYSRKYKKYKAKYKALKNKFIDLMDNNESSIVDQEDTRSLESKISYNSVEVSILRKDISEFSEDDFTTKVLENSEMILKIDNIETFDKFTDEYTKAQGDKLKIDWEKASEDFKGLYIENIPELRMQRYRKANKNGISYTSWWVLEMDTNDVIIFDRTEMTENDSDDPRMPLVLGSEDSDTVDSNLTDSDQLLRSV